MIIVLSPAKTLDYSFSEKEVDFSVPPFLSKSKNLVSTMKKLKKSELSSLMGVSDKISALNHDRFQLVSHELKVWLLETNSGIYHGLKQKFFH